MIGEIVGEAAVTTVTIFLKENCFEPSFTKATIFTLYETPFQLSIIRCLSVELPRLKE